MKEKKQVLAFYDHSIAFLEIAYSASIHDNGDRFNHSSYINAIAYQIHFALELFLKFALLTKIDLPISEAIKKVHGHDLVKLYDDYKIQFPDNFYNINMPFNFDKKDTSISDDQLNEIKNYRKRFNSPMDQLLKYPFDREGDFVANAYLFIFKSDYIKSTRELIEEIANKIITEYLK